MTQESRAYSRNLGVALDELLRVSDILRDDVVALIDAFKEDWGSQPMGRALVRASWAHIEGTVFAIKRFLLRACDLGSVDLSGSDRAFLSELIVVVDPEGTSVLQDQWFATLKNIKKTFKLAEIHFDLDWKPDFGTSGWERLIELLQIRHRLTHPKSAEQLYLTDAEVEVFRSGFTWFVEVFNELQLSVMRRHGRGPRPKASHSNLAHLSVD